MNGRLMLGAHTHSHAASRCVEVRLSSDKIVLDKNWDGSGVMESHLQHKQHGLIAVVMIKANASTPNAV